MQKILWIFVLLLPAINASADLEWGGGVSAVVFPDYVGSDEYQTLILPTPYFRYTSENLTVDRNLIQTKFFEQGPVASELSLGGSIPVDGDKNRARRGMDDLDWIGEIGPSLQYYWLGNWAADNALLLDAPLRVAASSDLSSAQWRGFTFEPKVRWRRFYPFHGLTVRPQITLGALAASADYHAYLYGVKSDDATASRPAYTAQGGFAGWQLSYSTVLQWRHYVLAGALRYINTDDAIFADSPLHKEGENILAGIMAAYVF